MSEAAKKTQQDENPLLNIIINVLLPVVILSKMSKESQTWYHLGPENAMYFALAFPICYGIWHFIQHKKCNIFSIVGVVSVLLTGVISLIIWKYDNLRPHAALLFGIKEAIQPLMLGSLFLLTHKSKSPLFNMFLFNDLVFNINKIEKKIKKEEKETAYKSLLWRSTLLFFGSFCVSSVLNIFVAYHFLGDLDPAAPNWKELYNEEVAGIMFWGFLVIGVPILVIGAGIITYLVKGLQKITAFKFEELLQQK